MTKKRGGLPASPRTRLAWAWAGIILLSLLVVSPAFLPASANGGDDHSHGGEKGAATKSAATSIASVRTAERNLQSPAGQFNVRLRQSPADPRAGEEVQFEIAVEEQVEGGFGGGGLQPVEAAKVTARVTKANGEAVETKLEAHGEGQPNVYGVHYAFGDSGEYKFIFDVRTPDNREFAVDFPVSIVSAPVNPAFWLGVGALALVSAGAVYGSSRSGSRVGLSGREAARRTLPIASGALVFFIFGIVALLYLSPPRERREIAAMPVRTEIAATTSATGDPALGGSGAVITIPKESQLLFKILTAPVEERQIISGLKTTGAVRAKPDARAVISPPVSGRVTFKGNVQIGAVVARGQSIGTIEQILGAPEQAGLEAQRIQLRTAALEQQSRSTEQQSLAQQAVTRLNQARRELQRATNLLAVGAAPQRRVEEAQTAVKLAEQEVASAQAQARIAGQQASLSRESVARVDPVRSFPLVSPVTGIIADLRATTGQQVEAGAELLNVVNLTSVLLEAQVFERDLAAVRDSGRASYTAPALNGEVYRIGAGGDGRLVSIGQSVNSQTRTVPVIFEVPNPLNRLREGMFVEITLDTSRGARVLAVPKASVITEQGRTFVFVFTGGEIYERRVIVLGAEGQEYYEVRSGVQPGERVVTEGIYQIRSTQPGA
ncbi:MAG: efflux RND transporter periplasmic adaptor subunit [Pyrinomonadaceae bacterium]